MKNVLAMIDLRLMSLEATINEPRDLPDGRKSNYYWYVHGMIALRNIKAKQERAFLQRLRAEILEEGGSCVES